MSVSKEEAEKRLYKTHGEKIKFIEYRGMGEYSSFICECGNIWDADTWATTKKNGCPACKLKKLSNHFRKPYEEVKEYIESYDYKLLSETYMKANKKLDILCSEGHAIQMTWNDFQTGNRCAVCSLDKKGGWNKLTEEQYIERLTNLGLVFDGFDGEFIGHRTKSFCICGRGHRRQRLLGKWMQHPYCPECRMEEFLGSVSGENSNFWQGGKTPIYEYLRRQIIPWKKASMEQCDFKCIITGERFDDIHHIKSFNTLFEETIQETQIELKEEVSSYTDEELSLLTETLLKKHFENPLGVCLKREIHNKFHSIYGSGNNTIDQWNEFCNLYLD